MSLASRVRQLSHPLEPLPTGVAPVTPRMKGVRAVLFDVYGTLIVSGSGDISTTSGVARGQAAEDALRACGLSAPVAGKEVVAGFTAAIHRDHAASQSEFPEVEIRDIWRDTLRRLAPSAPLPSDDLIETLAVEYECRVNPVWPMPDMAPTLHTLRDAGLTLGVISNAQFFTPIALVELAGQRLAELGFAGDLGFWSYEHRQAKPGLPLYQLAAQALAKRGIRPAETLFVGNDMRNDVGPAAAVGFRTVLFAGDARSLRMRESDRLPPADATITELRQLKTILSLAPS